ncbi:MAG TPA: hypothetical protein VG964_01965 [Candidatus Saccharimonadales bacterium]|nr:hypothetical protein [Candidatus Saccharimonadales bacterium]
MEWYFVAPIMLGWMVLCYGWAIIGRHLVESYADSPFDIEGLFYWIVWAACLFSWPVVAFSSDIRFDWYWWLVMFDILGLPYSLAVTISDIWTFGYTYDDRGEAAIVEYTILWLLVTVIWPLQWARKRFELGW